MNDLILLAALLGGPAYGYALKKTAGLIFGSKAMHPNVVYPSLKRFVQSGWVDQGSTPGDRGQTRKQYRITAAGRKYLLEQVGKFDEQDASDDGAFLFRVALFDALPKQNRQSILSARKQFLTSRSHQLAELRQTAHPRSFGDIALERVQTLVQNELLWIKRLEDRLESTKGDLKCKPLLTHQATVRRS
jgi:DNA-binding PadR family transcriptional regulator